MKKKIFKLSDFYLLESDSKILDFRCNKTNLIVWPILREEFLNLVISKLYYDSKLTNYNIKSNFVKKLSSFFKLINASMYFKNLFFNLKKKDILFFKIGYPTINLNSEVFNKNIDYYISLNKNNYVSFSRSLNFSFFKSYYDKEVYFLDFNENIIDLFSRFDKTNQKVSKEITLYLVKKIKKVFDIKLNNLEIQRLIKYNCIKINSIEKKIKFYKKLINKIKPKLAIVENASYSQNAILNYVLHNFGTCVAEPQHGIISKGHRNYNFSSLIRNNNEYKMFLPDDFLSYGKYFSESINSPLKMYNIGSPYRTQNKPKENKKYKGKKILLVSNGINLNTLPKLAKKLFFLLNKKYEIIIRPHPMEKNINMYENNKFSRFFKIDSEKNLYKSLKDKAIVISEMSTVLYDALNIVPKILMMRTKKSVFNLPNHPFEETKNLEQLIKKIKSDKHYYNKVELNKYFKNNWKQNFQKYIKKKL